MGSKKLKETSYSKCLKKNTIFSKIHHKWLLISGVIQQLRGQEEG